MTWAAVVLGLAQLPFIVNLIWSARREARAGDNPWEATTIEWQAASPPPAGNFATPPIVHRGPYRSQHAGTAPGLHAADGSGMIARLLPLAASQHAAGFDDVLTSVHVHIAVQAAAWGVFLLVCLIRFRRGRQPQARAAGVRPLWPVVAIAAVIVGDALLLATAAIPVWRDRARPPAEPPLEVRVTAEQFAWNIHYPGPDLVFGATSSALISAGNPLGIDRRDPRAADDIGILNVLTLPVGRPVLVHLTSRDVVHSFTLNEMRVKQDATPGLLVRTWFTPTRTGTWDIACSQLCGLGHYRMRGEYTVIAPEAWDAWQRSELALLPER